MPEGFALLLRVLAIGVGATLTMDIVAILQNRLFGVPLADYALVARWIGHMAHGQFRHASISKSPAVPHERGIGWLVHYATGVGYAVLLVATWGIGWTRDPTIWPPLILALVTLAIPLLIMQPAFGLGIAASRHPRPWAARLRSTGASGLWPGALPCGARLFAGVSRCGVNRRPG